jgi:hypothetical protein
VATDDALDRDELRTIALRAFAMARATDDPSLRAAVNLLGEAAANLAAKLPAGPSAAPEVEGER